MESLDGLLFFPVTPFGRSGELALGALRQHLEQGVAAGPGAVFIACGTGEFHTLSLSEYEPVVRAAVEVVGGRVPVFAGVGGPLGAALEMAQLAERLGADGLLTLPPYLVKPTPSGLVEYIRTIAQVTRLPLIVYNRDNALYDAQAAVAVARMPTVVGFKDGYGDMGLLGQIVPAVLNELAGTGKVFQFFNGMPTAEMSALAYRGLGISLYSSAIWCFAPEISRAFHGAVTAGDTVTTTELITGFFSPFVELRNQLAGGAISLVKAAVCLGGLDVGGVRPPLVDPAPGQRDQLAHIVATGRQIAAASSTAAPQLA
ncbi:MAG: 5-dehydro-4-deoxyglucarate dehydratase [Micromonosporaceae bacterium]|nr:5-dehydro-4-deoxyglucarate dehydratase [Micromonosporaceae bacterium]